MSRVKSLDHQETTTDPARAALLRTLHLAPWPERGDTEKAVDTLIAAVRAEGRDPYDSLTEHRQQERAGTHLQDTTDCYFCQRAESAETLAALLRLDVEVLAEALEVIGARWDPDGMELAPLVAAEYARLEAER